VESFLTWDGEAANRFPTLLVCVGVIRGVKVERSNQQIETLKNAGESVETISVYKSSGIQY